MALDQDIALLARVGLLEGFGPDQLRLIAFGAQKRDLSPGEVLYHQGELTPGGFVVQSGTIELISKQNENETSLGMFLTGSVVGQMALITNSLRLGTAYAREPSTVMLINRATFMRVLEEYPDLAVSIHKRISASLKELTGELEKLKSRFS